MTERRRLSAIMFSDIVGYSRMMGEDEKRALRLVEEHNQIIEPIVEKKGGEILKFLGDGVLSSFDSASDAVSCGIEIQKKLAERNSDKEENEKIEVRIGIHIGDVIVKEGEIYGDGVNIASRIESIAEPGGICITQTVYDLVKARPEIQTIEVGPRELKNIKEAVNIYKVLIEAEGEYTGKYGISDAGEESDFSYKKVYLLILLIFIVIAGASAGWWFYGEKGNAEPARDTSKKAAVETEKMDTKRSSEDGGNERKTDTAKQKGERKEKTSEKEIDKKSGKTDSRTFQPPGEKESEKTGGPEKDRSGEKTENKLAEGYRKEGIDLYKKEKYEESIHFLKKALEESPGDEIASEYLTLAERAMEEEKPETVYSLGKRRVFPPLGSAEKKPDTMIKPRRRQIITGAGVRVNWGNVVNLRIKTRYLKKDGNLSEKTREYTAGSDRGFNTEAFVELPSGYAAVGFGIEVEKDDVSAVYLYGRKLKDGSLTGPVEKFTGGDKGSETPSKKLELKKRVLTGIGLSSGFRKVKGIRLITQKIISRSKD